jgi:hypothetical protein
MASGGVVCVSLALGACSTSGGNGAQGTGTSGADAAAAMDASAGVVGAADSGAGTLATDDGGSGAVGTSDGSTGADGASDGGVGADAAATALLSGLTVSTGSLVPSFDPNVFDYQLTSLNSLFPVSVTATACNCAAGLSIRGTPATSGVPASFTLGAGETFTVVAQGAGGGSVTYSLHYTPASLPAYTVATADPDEVGSEPILLSLANFAFLVDRSGALIYYRDFSPQGAENFQRHVLPSGATVYSTLVGTSAGSWTLGVNHLMDAQFQDIGDVQILANRAHGALPSEGHDFLLLDDQHYVAETYIQRTVDLSGLNPSWSATATVMNAIVQEVDHGVVKFEWDSADVPSLYTDSTEENTFKTGTVCDYLHLNALAVDPTDQNFVFSLRHTNSIVKVDRTTGQILWTLGGAEDSFGLTADQAFFHQHHVHFQADGSLAVFDNGNNGPGQPTHQTRVLTFVLDEVNHVVKDFEVVYGKPDDEPQTQFMGSATQLDSDRYLIGWGGWRTADIEPAVTEIVDGIPVWNLTFTSPNVFSYRALPIPSE